MLELLVKKKKRKEKTTLQMSRRINILPHVYSLLLKMLDLNFLLNFFMYLPHVWKEMKQGGLTWLWL